MSQSDSFIEEVTEEVRRDRLFAMMRRYGWIAIALVLLLVAGAAWREYQKAQDRTAAEGLGDALLSALEQSDPGARSAALATVPATSNGQQAVVAFLAAAEAAQAGDASAAADRLEAVAELADLPQVYRDLARFKALALRAEELTPQERIDGYTALARPGSGLRLLAEEQIALSLIETGDAEAALSALRAILADAEVTSGLRQRASQLMVALGEDPAAGDANTSGNE
ncbi:tetratricopeptide repeat protein [Pseudooceanicola sp.]|uniref:tetratricopeptide repeat protein n=1 Tax=Pseudooceanicola sp. TaxID=1914328 RepID=UPI002631A11D|nr:tetratricopeptide repeat protein [Pseudooceanicola sp.]MDF1856890.1 tetratricopeptide repeat protein [Pseudooceanicola sp.]